MMYKKEKKKDYITINLFAFLTALFFAPIITYQLGLGLGFSLKDFPYTLNIITIVVVVYIAFIWVIIYKALRLPEYNFEKEIVEFLKSHLKKTKNKKKKKLDK